MAGRDMQVLVGEIVEEEFTLTLDELCCACKVEQERIVELIEHGVLDAQPEPDQQFRGDALWRARLALRLQRDLGVNAAGASLAIELLQRIEALEARLRLR